MEKKRLNFNFKTIIIILLLLILTSVSLITFAWFTDKKSFSGNLDFGTIVLDVSGDGISNKSLNFKVTRTNLEYQTGGKIMPGDVVNIPLKIGLTAESEDAYYLVFLSDPKGIFESGVYFSDDGTNVFVGDGLKIYNQTTKAVVSNKIIGKLSKGTSGHNITLSAVISTGFEQQKATTTLNCTVCAIQQANLDEATAKQELNENFGIDLLNVDKREIANCNGYSSTIDRTITGNQYMVGFAAGGYWAPSITTLNNLSKDEISITAENNLHGLGFDVKCKAGEKYMLSYDCENGLVGITWYKNSGEYFTGSNSFTSKTFTIGTDITAFVIVFRAEENNKIATFSNFKLVKIY